MANQLMIIGGGKMGEALTAGLVNADWTEIDSITVVEPLRERREDLKKIYSGLRVIAEPEPSDDVLLAVKPTNIQQACEELSSCSPKRIISIAAGVKTATLEGLLPPRISVIRVMPNTPAMINVGMSVLSAGSYSTDDDLEWASSIFSAVGKTTIVDEGLLDAVTGLSGSGPAYVFALAEAMIAAGLNEGLDKETSELLAIQTVLGAARLMEETSETPRELRDAVTSPNGTTAAALSIFEDNSFSEIILEAISAATSRAAELGS